MRKLAILITTALMAACSTTSQRPDDKVWESLPGTVSGQVFADSNADGNRQDDESGVANVLVSNGRDVVRTDENGHYRLPLLDDMNLTVVQPGGWRVPLDDRNLPRFFHVHKAGGSPELRYGGLPNPGFAPERVDFPLHRHAEDHRFRCAIVGDSQTYSNNEVGYFRDSAASDLLDTGLASSDCMIYLGDVVGDDLGLLDRLMAVGSTVGAAQWLVQGNHDLDFDATSPADSSDSWRKLAMPDYYAFEMGQVLFVALNNVVYPCGAEDARLKGREFCVDDNRPRYNGRLPDQQLEWLANLLDHVPKNRRIVLLHHIPLVSFSDADSPIHQTDNAAAIHALLAGRPALSLSGHTHTLENLAPGEWYEGWRAQTGVGPLPFRHIVAGAASGGWWLGDFEYDAVPMAIQRMGAPRGVLMLDFEGIDYTEHFRPSGFGAGRGQWVSFNTPDFRRWHQAIADWLAEPADQRDPLPPLSLHDLEDTHLFTPGDLAEGVYLTANVWLGSAETRVEARINEQPTQAMERTQQGQGEAPRQGAAWTDPFSTRRMLSMSRQAIVSRSGDQRAQGYEGFQAVSFRGNPGPQARNAPDRNVHLWRLRLPQDLPLGTHIATVTSTDRHGKEWVDRVIFEVTETRPPRYWQKELWE